MPLFAAAQGGILFPLNWFYLVFSPIVATNLMVISSYMIAGLGAYLFARRANTSIAGAVVTGLIWQFSGFLIGQISHINIVQTAAMLPWILWALERYAANGSRGRGALLAALVALQAFAGHQQAFVYSLMLLGAYAMVMGLANIQRSKRYFLSLGFTAAGVLLAAVQIVPTFELLRNSLRQIASYEFFSSFSMPKAFVRAILAPYVMGGGDGRLFRAPYISQAFYTEYVVYAGILGIMLVLVAVLLKRDTSTKFWAVTAIVGLLLAFGSYAPLRLYRLIYFVPVLNLFRVPARHLMEVEFALAVLAGRGLTALAELRESARTRRQVAVVIGLICLLTSLVVTWWRPENFRLGREAPVSILRAPELFVPILLAALSAWAVWFFLRRRRGATALLLALLAVDLFVWGQSSGWYMASRDSGEEFWHLPDVVRVLRERAPGDPASYRVLTAQHTFNPEIPPVPPSISHSPEWTLWSQPDVYTMYGIQNAAGYDGFGLERYGNLAGEMKLWGELTDPDRTLRGDSREIDLLNARYLLAMRRQKGKDEEPPPAALPFLEATEKYEGLMFAQTDLAAPNVRANKPLRFIIPPVEADSIALLTNLSWAENVPDDAVVGRLRLRTVDGRDFEFELRAGLNTADWAYDRPDIRGRIRHKRPTIATSYDALDARYKYQGHRYATSFAFPEKLKIAGGEIMLASQATAPDLLLTVSRISLVNKSEARTYPLRREWLQIDSAKEPAPKSDRWTLLAQTLYVDVYENARALPRAWLASEALVMDERAILQVIRNGRLPDESKWDPLRTVLVESELPGPLTGEVRDGRAEITTYGPNRVSLKTHASGNSILVLSENAYPGWYVYVDGQPAPALRVDYNLRGVLIPTGEHQVSFVYRPWSVMIGLLLSLATALGLGVLSVRRRR